MRAALLILILFLGSCGLVPRDLPPPASETQISELAAAIGALDPQVDPAEAARAARISFTYSRQLAEQYEIEDSPLVHNIKVNRGTKPRGLCWHWAEDLEKRLAQENFQTLDLHRGIANADSRILIDHSSVMISAEGDRMEDGIVLDPWRNGGRLFWAPVREDTRYPWRERMQVLREEGRIVFVNRYGAQALPQ